MSQWNQYFGYYIPFPFQFLWVDVDSYKGDFDTFPGIYKGSMDEEKYKRLQIDNWGNVYKVHLGEHSGKLHLHDN